MKVYDGSEWCELRGGKIYDGTAWRDMGVGSGICDGTDWYVLKDVTPPRFVAVGDGVSVIVIYIDGIMWLGSETFSEFFLQYNLQTLNF